MKDSVYTALKTNIKAVLKQMDFKVYLYSVSGLVFLSLLFMSFSFMNLADWLIFLGLAVFFGLSYLTFPLLYGVTAYVADSVRYEKKSYSLKDVFTMYYRKNPGTYGLGSVLWKTIVALVLSSIVFTGLATAIVRSVWPGLYSLIESYLYNPNIQTQSLDAAINSSEYAMIYRSTYMIVLGLTNGVTVGIASSELRKNEAVFYCASCLVSDNQLNIQTRPIIPLFRRGVLPTVSKEHMKYNFLINYPGYLVFFISYAGFIALGLFFMNGANIYFLVPFMGLAFSSLLYSPFYVFCRVFDDLFYVAYSDKIFHRLTPSVRNIVAQVKEAMSPFVKKDEDVSEGNFDEDEAGQAKKGQTDDDGTIDFTSDDDKKGKNGKDE